MDITETNINLNYEKNELAVCSENVRLVYSLKEPEHSVIMIGRHNLPDIRIRFSEWQSVFQVLSDWSAFVAWSQVKKELDEN